MIDFNGEFFKEEPKFFIPLAHVSGCPLLEKEELYNYQIGHLASALLIADYNPEVPIDKAPCSFKTEFKFPKDSLISGSFMMHLAAKNLSHPHIKYDDIDIYFRSKDDAKEFCTLNGISSNNVYGFSFNGDVCAYGHAGPHKINLIFGIEYDNPGHLISRFDIRACSMALDPNTGVLHVVRGALEDATNKRLVFNPVPRGVSVRRFAKYIQKGFTADKHQNLFFVELLRSDIYKPELELLTKEY